MPVKLALNPLGNTKMNSIEAARGIAALLVVFMHAANMMKEVQYSGHYGMGKVFDFGYVGVDFFFVLSGFIITYVHYGELDSFKRMPHYLWRRFSRIYPIYWTILILTVLIVTLGKLSIGKPLGFDIGFVDMPGTIFLLMGYGEPKYIGVAWTLQYEVVFYLAFCLLFMSTRIGAMVFTIWGGAILASALGFMDVVLPLNLANPHCFEFLLGVAVAVAARKYQLGATPALLVFVLLSFVAAVLFEVYGPYGRHAPIGRLALGFASAAILATLVGLERQQALNTPKWLVRLGSASYSIYLGHILFIGLTYQVLVKLGLYHQLPEWLVFFSAVIFALVGTMFIGLRVELPIVSVLKNRWGRRIKAT